MIDLQMSSHPCLTPDSKFSVLNDAIGDPFIPCAAGHVFEHGPTLLAYTGDTRGWRALLLAIPGVRSWQTGDQEFTVVFPPDALKAVAKVVRPRRKRVISDAVRARLAEYAFRPGERG